MPPTLSMPTKSNTGKFSPRRQATRLRRLLRSSRSKDFFIFAFFVLVSYLFWLLLTLDDDMQRELSVRLEITGVPENVTFISDVPQAVQVNLRDKGSMLINYKLGPSPQLKIPYKDFTYDEFKDRVFISEHSLQNKLRALFGSTAQIVSAKPDSLSFIVTTKPPTLAHVVPRISVTPAPQCVISGPITVTPDTVKVFSSRHIPLKITEVKTLKVTRSNVSDTLHLEVLLHPESGIRMVPDRVAVMVPVEPLIAKSRDVNISLIHASGPNSVVLFPSHVNVSYLVPMSLYNSENSNITVTADFLKRSSSRIPLTLTNVPPYCQGAEISTDSVEYLIEQKVASPVSNQ